MTDKPTENEVIQNIPETKEITNQQNENTVSTDTGSKESETKQETPQETNWRQFREQRRIDREAAEQAKKIAEQKAAEAEALKAALEAIVNKNQPVQTQATKYYDEEEKPVEDINKKIEQLLDEREKKRDEQNRQREVAELPTKLTRDFKDFNQVVNQENLDYFEYHFPEIAAPFKYMPDSYEKWASIYKTVNRLMPESSTAKAKNKIMQNLDKPKSPSAPGAEQSHDSAPIYLDDAKRQSNWARMQKVIKGIS